MGHGTRKKETTQRRRSTICKGLSFGVWLNTMSPYSRQDFRGKEDDTYLRKKYDQRITVPIFTRGYTGLGDIRVLTNQSGKSSMNSVETPESP